MDKTTLIKAKHTAVMAIFALALLSCKKEPHFKNSKGCGFDGSNPSDREITKSSAIADSLIGQPLGNVTIPIIFHVIYSNDAENISLEDIRREIDDLNRDFMKINADTANVHPLYKNRIGNPKISFVLADTLFPGSKEFGVRRIKSSKRRNLYKIDPVIAPDRYLNIYSGNINSDGFTYSEPWSNSPSDAIFLYYEWIGGSYRLLTHETGHWLGLYHTFGSCGHDSDGIADTPPQKRATGLNIGCDPKNIKHASCDPGNIHMFNNYMDYSDCRFMFTKQQAQVMRHNLFMHRSKVYRSKK